MKMKYYLSIALFFLSALSLHAQSEKSEAITILLKETKAEEDSRELMSVLIKEFLKRKPNAPKSIEREIHNAIDYKAYMNKVKATYDESYTEEEIRDLTQLYKTNKELYKQKSKKVEKALYNLGTEFGRQSVGVINAMLQFY